MLPHGPWRLGPVVCVAPTAAGVQGHEWPEFEAAYLQTYADLARFALLFDLRQLGIPPADLARRMVLLKKRLQARTAWQVSAVAILVGSLMDQILKACGQKAPVLITADASAAAAYVVKPLARRPAALLLPPTCEQVAACLAAFVHLAAEQHGGLATRRCF